jgi:arylsulfatase A-like enzyme
MTRFSTFALVCLCLANPQAPAAETKRPNILFIFADDWGRFASAYGKLDGPGSPNDVVKTPNFDRIAREGTLVRQAFVSAPSCTPCRSALLSGQHFWRTGRAAILQGAVWDESIPTYPRLLAKAGYHMGKTGKVWSPGNPADIPYGRPVPGFQKSGMRFNNFSKFVTEQVEAGKTVDACRELLQREVRGNFEDFLAKRPTQTPFAYWFGPTHVHRKWIKGSGKALWGINPDDLKGKLPPFLPDIPEMREDFADYLGEVQALDAYAGVLLDTLEKAGELDNTLVVMSGDHGPPGFPHGKCNLYDFGSRVALALRGPGVEKGKVSDTLVSLPDLAPTFLEMAGVNPPATMTANSLQSLGVIAGTGQTDRKAVNRDAVYIGRERHYPTARDGGLPYPQRAIRTKDHLYIINFRPDRWPLGDPRQLQDGTPSWEKLANNTGVTLSDEDAGPAKAWLVINRNTEQGKPYFDRAYGKRPAEELYVLAEDPHQMRNRAQEPALETTRKNLRERLLKTLEETGDPRVRDNGKFFETPPLAGPVQGWKEP